MNAEVIKEEHVTTVILDVTCRECGAVAHFVDDSSQAAEMFVVTDAVAVIPWLCPQCGSSGVIYLLQNLERVEREVTEERF